MASKTSNNSDAPKELDDYDFETKRLSRDEISRYFEINFKTFHDKKVLLLSSWQGLDIKQIFDPLGFKRSNLTVVERDSKVYALMKGNPLFNGTDMHEKDLKDFKPAAKFDVLYLDFKGWPTDDTLDLIRYIILNYAKSGTILYLNLLAKREQPYRTEKV